MNGYYFYKRRPLAEYSWLVRVVVRLLYRRMGWNTDDGSVESQAFFICDEQEAKRISNETGWAFQELPVNLPLPDETCQYGLNLVPHAPALTTTDRNLPFVAVSRRTIEWVVERLNVLVGKAAP